MKKQATTKSAKKASKTVQYEPEKVLVMVAVIAVLTIVLLGALGLSADYTIPR